MKTHFPIATIVVISVGLVSGSLTNAQTPGQPSSLKASPTPTPTGTPPQIKTGDSVVKRVSRKPMRRSGELARPVGNRDLQPSWPIGEQAPLTAAVSTDEFTRNLYEKAAVLVRQGKPAESLVVLQEAEKLNATRFEIPALIGTAFLMMRRFDESLAAFQRAVKLDPKNARIRLAVCGALEGAGRRAEAIEECRKALELDPQDNRARTQLAQMLLLDERANDALALLELSYARSQDDIVALGTMADIYYSRNEFPRALEIYERIALKWPVVSLTYLRLSGVYDFLGRGQDSIKAARNFLELEPKLFLAQFNLGLTLKDFGFFDESIVPLDLAKATKPEIAEVYLTLSAVYEALGDRDNLTVNLKEAYTRMPKSAELSYRYGLALGHNGKKEESIPVLEEANELIPNNQQVLLSLGFAYESLGQIDKGIALIDRALLIAPLPPGMVIDTSKFRDKNKEDLLAQYEELLAAVKKNPNDGQAHIKLSYVYQFKGMHSEAEREMLEAIRITPIWQNYNGLGIYYYERGQYDKALPAFRKVAEANPHHVVFLTISNTLERLGRLDEAIIEAKRSIEIKSTLPESRLALGDLYQKKGVREEAISEFLAAYNLNPVDPRANMRLVWLYIRTRNKHGAFRHYEILKNVAPGQIQNVELSLRAHFGNLP